MAPRGLRGKKEGRLKREDGVFEGFNETKQPTGYKTVSIILSKLQECKA